MKTLLAYARGAAVVAGALAWAIIIPGLPLLALGFLLRALGY